MWVSWVTLSLVPEWLNHMRTEIASTSFLILTQISFFKSSRHLSSYHPQSCAKPAHIRSWVKDANNEANSQSFLSLFFIWTNFQIFKKYIEWYTSKFPHHSHSNINMSSIGPSWGHKWCPICLFIAHRILLCFTHIFDTIGKSIMTHFLLMCLLVNVISGKITFYCRVLKENIKCSSRKLIFTHPLKKHYWLPTACPAPSWTLRHKGKWCLHGIRFSMNNID